MFFEELKWKIDYGQHQNIFFNGENGRQDRNGLASENVITNERRVKESIANIKYSIVFIKKINSLIFEEHMLQEKKSLNQIMK